MSAFIDKVKTLGWFIKNPSYLPQVYQLSKRLFNKKLEHSREEASHWCRESCIPAQTALKELGTSFNYLELHHRFPAIIAAAKEKEGESKLEMGGEGAISFIYSLCRAFKVKRAVESGVAYGWSSLAILLAIKDQQESKLISNDMPYVRMNNEDSVGLVVPNELSEKWELQRNPDIIGIPMALDKFNGEIDFFHYDSDKSYIGRMWAAPRIWKALKEGGLFVADDINDNLAFKHFAEKVDRKPVVVEHLGKYVGVLKK